MNIFGVGLSKTGTHSLHLALKILGYRCLHWSPERLYKVLISASNDFKVYDDVDAVLDLPAAYFYKEIMEVYPNCICILTVRDENGWLKSIRRHIRHMTIHHNYNFLERTVHKLVYGTDDMDRDLLIQKFNDHNSGVIREIPSSRLLVMNITAGDNWKELCCFLRKSVPNCPFPHAEQSKSIITHV
jgi:acyl-homoserine lactone acylase PvdQ